MKNFIALIGISALVGALSALLVGVWSEKFTMKHPSEQRQTTSTANHKQPSRFSSILKAEFNPSESVVVSENLILAYKAGLPFVQKLLDDGNKVIILVNDYKDEDPKDLLKKGTLANFKDQIHFLSIPHSSIWVRDFGAFVFSESHDGNFPIRTIFNFTYRSSGMLNDTVPYIIGLYLESDVINTNLKLDGGNFLTDTETCLVSHSEENDLQLEPKKREDIFKNRLGCKKLLQVYNPPHEHVDMWAKITSKKTLLVNHMDYLNDEILATINSEQTELITRTKSQLKSAHKALRAQFKIKKIPQPLPLPGLFRTYSNAILVNGRAYVPRYRKIFASKEPYPDQDLLIGFEKATREAYESEGFKVTYIDSDEFIAEGGALHCLAFTIPAIQHKTLASTLRANNL